MKLPKRDRVYGYPDWATSLPKIWPEHVFPLLNRYAPINWLEIGSFEGRSALWTVENMFLDEDSRITCVDPWIPWDADRDFEANFDLNTHGISRIVKRKGKSNDILPTLVSQRYHGVYIDGLHEAECALSDARLSLPLLLPGAVMIFDDYQWEPGGVKEEANQFLNENPQVKPMFVGWQLVCQLAR